MLVALERVRTISAEARTLEELEEWAGARKAKGKTEVGRVVGAPDEETASGRRHRRDCRTLHGGQEERQLTGPRIVTYRVTGRPSDFNLSCPPGRLGTCVPTKGALFVRTPKQGQPRCLSADDWRNEIEHIHTAECDSAIKGNKVASAQHGRTLTASRQMHATRYKRPRIVLLRDVQNRSIHRGRKQSSVCPT